jgi:hypothetical protein
MGLYFFRPKNFVDIRKNASIEYVLEFDKFKTIAKAFSENNLSTLEWLNALHVAKFVKDIGARNLTQLALLERYLMAEARDINPSIVSPLYLLEITEHDTEDFNTKFMQKVFSFNLSQNTKENIESWFKELEKN